MLPMFCLAFGVGSSTESARWTNGTGSACSKTPITPAAFDSAGLRLGVGADDVFVHHFGEGSFGRLVPSGKSTPTSSSAIAVGSNEVE